MLVLVVDMENWVQPLIEELVEYCRHRRCRFATYLF